MRVTGNKAAAHTRPQRVAVDWSMTGKTVLFTGASRGMGRFAAIELARLGAEILIVGHNEARGDAAAGAIRGAGGSAQFLRADLGDAAQVCALAASIWPGTTSRPWPASATGSPSSGPTASRHPNLIPALHNARPPYLYRPTMQVVQPWLLRRE